MCYLARDQAARGVQDGSAADAPAPLPRQRWIAAGALALAGGVALAAWFTREPAVAVVQEPARAAAAVAVGTPSPPSPAEPVVLERIMIGVPDGIPVPPEMSAAGEGTCAQSL